MRLWTYHRDGFSPVGMPLDPSKSRFYQLYPGQYRELWNRLGTDQLLWCVNDPSEWPRKVGYLEWVLEVPESEFLAVANSTVWNGILGHNTCSNRLRDRFESHAISHGVKDVEAYIAQKIAVRQNPGGNPWDHLLKADAKEVDSDILLKIPISEFWVIDTVEHT